MARDLAIDYNTGDLVIAPNRDFALRQGQATVEQRIRVRLRIYQGEWLLDPTGGTLGSHLHDVMRMPTFQATEAAGLFVKEALQYMDDILVSKVEVELTPNDPRSIDLALTYRMVGADGPEGPDLTLPITFTFTEA